MPKKYNKQIPVQALSNEVMNYLEDLGTFEFHENEKMMCFGKPSENLEPYSQLAYDRYKHEMHITEHTSFTVTKAFHKLRGNLALAIHAKLTSVEKLLRFNEEQKWNNKTDETKNLIIKKRMTDEIIISTKRVNHLKRKVGLKEGAKAEFEFIKYDKFYTPPRNKKTKINT